MKTRNIVMLMLLIAVAPECRKDRKPDVYHVEQHVKDWLFFDTGTWWVYRDVNSGIRDSQYVTRSEIITDESQPKRKHDLFYIFQYAQVYTNTGSVFFLNSTMGGSMIEKTDTSSGGSPSTPLFYKPTQIGSRHSSFGLGFIEITDLDPHFTLDGTKYDTLITLLNNDDQTAHHDSVQYQVYKGVGIIGKKNISKHQEWQLVKYHINLNKR